MQSGGGTTLGDSQNTTGQALEQSAVALKSDLLEKKGGARDLQRALPT